MERRTWTPGEKAKSIQLLKAHTLALRQGADFSRPHYLGDPSIEAEQELDKYWLNDSKDDLLFNVTKDGTTEVDGIHQWWDALHNDKKTYGTADPVKKRIFGKDTKRDGT